MSELTERRWAVMSERGCEAANLTYEEAARLVRQVTGDKVSGTCIITNEAAARVRRRGQKPGDGNRSAESTPQK